MFLTVQIVVFWLSHSRTIVLSAAAKGFLQVSSFWFGLIHPVDGHFFEKA